MGSFLIGLLLGLFNSQYFTSPELKYLLVIGFCGSFTTFSAFSSERIKYLINTSEFRVTRKTVQGLDWLSVKNSWKHREHYKSGEQT